MKQVSVIIPCYNAEKYIRRCLDSLIGQTIGVDNLEIITVNDASTDGTLDVLLEYESKYPDSMIVINCEENHKQGAARNLGLTYASADYVGYVDADDWCEPDMYRIMYQAACQYDCDIVQCNYVRDDGLGGLLADRNDASEVSAKYIVLDDKNRSHQFAFGDVLRTEAWSKLCKKEMLIHNDIYFMEGVIYEDNFWNGLLCLYAEKILTIDLKLYHYFVNWESSTLRENTKKHFDLFTVCEHTWNEFMNRGILDMYEDAVKYYFIRIFYWQGLKMLSFRFQKPPYDAYLYMVHTMRTLIPDWRENYYVRECTADFYINLLNMIDKNLSENDFYELMDLARQNM